MTMTHTGCCSNVVTNPVNVHVVHVAPSCMACNCLCSSASIGVIKCRNDIAPQQAQV
jgi:hypothetical protein